MRLNELKVPFRWYDDVTKTTRFNKSCSPYRYKLITPKDRMLPFMFRFPIPATRSLPLHLRIYNSDTNALEVTVDDTITRDYIDYYSFEEWDYLVYKGEMALYVSVPDGFHYAVLEMMDGTLFYSEEFWVDCDTTGNTLVTSTDGEFNDDFNDDFVHSILSSGVPSSLPKYTKLTWWNSCDIGDILYQSGYVNVLYVDADIIKGEPQIVEEGAENGAKEFVRTFVKLTDTCSYTDYLPEHVVNALSGINIHEKVYITTKEDLLIGSIQKFAATFQYQTLCHAKVDVKFEQESILMRSQCCGNNTIVEVYKCTSHISGFGFQSADNGNGTTSIGVFWNLDLGTGPFRVTSPQVSGGAPNDTNNTTFPLGSFAHGAQVIVSVKPVCNAANGRQIFGNVLTMSIVVP